MAKRQSAWLQKIRGVWTLCWRERDEHGELQPRSTACHLLNPPATTKTKREQAKRAKTKELQAHRPNVGSLPIHVACDLYLEDCKARLRPPTVSGYFYGLKQFKAWAKEERHLTTASLRPEHLQSLRAYLARGRGIASLNSYLRILRVFFNWLRRGKRIHLQSDEIGDQLRSEPSETREIVILSREEIQRVLATAPAKYRDFTLAMLLGGFRAKEARHLHQSQIKTNGIQFGRETKTKTPRLVTFKVSPLLQTVLARRTTPYLFGARGRPLGLTTAAKILAEIRKASGVYVTWQITRHTTASYLVNSSIFGGNAWRAAKHLGHSAVVANRHYWELVEVDPDAKTIEEAMGIES